MLTRAICSETFRINNQKIYGPSRHFKFQFFYYMNEHENEHEYNKKIAGYCVVIELELLKCIKLYIFNTWFSNIIYKMASCGIFYL